MIVDVAGAAAALQAADDILILTHRRPDGDTAGCAGALCRGLQQIGKRAYILENPEITRRYAPLIVPYYPPEDFVPAYVVSTDIAEEKLFPDTAEPYKGNWDTESETDRPKTCSACQTAGCTKHRCSVSKKVSGEHRESWRELSIMGKTTRSEKCPAIHKSVSMAR